MGSGRSQQKQPQEDEPDDTQPDLSVCRIDDKCHPHASSEWQQIGTEQIGSATHDDGQGNQK